MQYGISIEGPVFALQRLQHELRSSSPRTKKAPQSSKNKEKWGKLSFVETDHGLLDDTLKGLYRTITSVEKALSLRTKLDIRVRNLAYSEPSSGSRQYSESFNPIPSITVLPWGTSAPQTEDDRTIILDLHNAFGSGKHPSTRLCLKIMDRMAKDTSKKQKLRGGKVLDFGCGTGLLAIAAIKMGAKTAVGVEIDGPSAEAANVNVKLNHLSHAIAIKKGSWDTVQEKYDLIMANLVASVHIRTGKYLPVHLKNQGLAVVSGFGENQLNEMKQLFIKMGLIIFQQFTLESWAALVLKKEERLSRSRRPTTTQA
jgi:ribosomal protein L11 methyltransferase